MRPAIVGLGIMCALCAAAAGAEEQPATVGPTAGYEPLVAALRGAVASEVAAKDLPAFSIALVDGDRVVWAAGFGFQDAARKRPAGANTIYRVGSVSKLFTDIGVMQLVEQGKLDLDAPVSQVSAGLQAAESHRRADHAAAAHVAPLGAGARVAGGQLLRRHEPQPGRHGGQPEPDGARLSAEHEDEVLERRRWPWPAMCSSARKARRSTPGCARRCSSRWRCSDSDFELTPTVEAKLADALMWTYDDRRFAAPKFALGTAPAGNMYSSVLDLAKFVMRRESTGRNATATNRCSSRRPCRR